MPNNEGNNVAGMNPVTDANQNLQNPVTQPVTEALEQNAQPALPVEPSQPVQPVAPVTEINPGVVPSAEPMKAKKKNLVPLILVLVLVVAGIAGFAVWRSISNNPTNIFKKAINNSYKEFSDSLEKNYKDDFSFDIFKDSFVFSGDVQFSGDLFKGIEKDKIEYSLGYDYASKSAELMGNIKEDGKDLIGGTFYVKDDKALVKSNLLNNKLVDLEMDDVSEMLDIEELQDLIDELNEELENVEAPKTEDIEFVVAGLKDALIEALDEKNMEKSKEEIEVNGKKVKTTKVTYTVDEKSAEAFVKAFADAVIGNDKLIKKIAEMIPDVEESDIKDMFKEMKSDADFEGLEKGKMAIYTTGVACDLVKFEYVLDDITISYSNYKDDTVFYVEAEGQKIELVSTKENNVTKISLKLNKDEIAKLTIRQFDEKGIDFDFEAKYMTYSVSGSFKFTSETKDKTTNGVFEFNVKADLAGEKFDAGVKASYKFEVGAKVANINVKDAVVFDDLTEEDASALEKALEDFENSDIYSFVEDMDFDLFDTDYDYDYDYDFDDDDDFDFDFDFDNELDDFEW